MEQQLHHNQYRYGSDGAGADPAKRTCRDAHDHQIDDADFLGDLMNNNATMFFTKLLISTVLTLVVLILIKANNGFKTKFYKEVYSTNISFAPISDLYNKYIGNIGIFNDGSTEAVFSEKLIYNKLESYIDGVKLNLDSNLVPINESGIVVFIGENDKEVPVELTFDHNNNCWTFETGEIEGVYKVTYTATTQYNSESKTFKITCGDYYEPTITIAGNKLEDSKVVYNGKDIKLEATFAQESGEGDKTGKYVLTVVASNADGKELFNYDINVNLKDTNAKEVTANFTPSSWSLSLSGDNASSKTTSGNTSKWTISGVGSYELKLTVNDANGNSATKSIKFNVSGKTEPKKVKDDVVGIVLIVVSVVILGGVILFFALAGKRNKTKRTSIRTKND